MICPHCEEHLKITEPTQEPKLGLWYTPSAYGKTSKQLLILIESIGLKGKIEIHPSREYDAALEEIRSLREEITALRKAFDYAILDGTTALAYRKEANEIRDEREKK